MASCCYEDCSIADNLIQRDFLRAVWGLLFFFVSRAFLQWRTMSNNKLLMQENLKPLGVECSLSLSWWNFCVNAFSNASTANLCFVLFFPGVKMESRHVLTRVCCAGNQGHIVDQAHCDNGRGVIWFIYIYSFIYLWNAVKQWSFTLKLWWKYIYNNRVCFCFDLKWQPQITEHPCPCCFL